MQNNEKYIHTKYLKLIENAMRECDYTEATRLYNKYLKLCQLDQIKLWSIPDDQEEMWWVWIF